MLRRAEIGSSVACASQVPPLQPDAAVDTGTTAAGTGAELRFAPRVGGRLEINLPGSTVRLTRRRVIEC